MMKLILIVAVLVAFTACSNYKSDPRTSVIGQFFKALGSGDISKIKKPEKEQESEKEWEEISEIDSQ